MMRTIGLTVVAVAILCLASFTPAFGVIMHPGGEPEDDWTGRPHKDVVGRWGSNASCVAIAPNYIITTRHQGGGTGTTVYIGGDPLTGGDPYTIAQIWNHPTADIRIVKLNNANLTNYVSLYTETSEIDDEIGKNFVIGGFGKGRGDDLETGGTPPVVYGYLWEGSNNETQRWGTNIVDNAFTKVAGSYTSYVLKADFDESDTAFEASPTEWDSGGGWFINVGGEWQLAALSAYVEHLDETRFRNTGGNTDPDWSQGIRISPYSEWINNTIPEPGTMIFLTLGAAGMILRRRR